MIAPIDLNHLQTISLLHAGDCHLIGVTPEGTLYAEEIYDDGSMAQHKISADGVLKATVDEAHEADQPLTPLAIPLDIHKPARVWHTMALNYAGARHRGLRALDRVDDVVKTVSIADKIALVDRLNLNIAPPSLIGLAESYVLAEAQVIRPRWFLVCRRMRFAYALPARQADADDQPYDYDTSVLYAVHFYNAADDEHPPLASALNPFGDVTLHRPMDCLVTEDRLYIADGGAEGDGASLNSRIHVWAVTRPDTDSPDDQWRKKLYG